MEKVSSFYTSLQSIQVSTLHSVIWPWPLKHDSAYFLNVTVAVNTCILLMKGELKQKSLLSEQQRTASVKTDRFSQVEDK